MAESRSATAAPAAIGRARATPPVRLLARRLGVDLERLAEGRAERLVRENDVLAAAAPPVPHRPGGQPSDFLREDRTPIKGVRRATAEAMVSSAFTAPHVTEWLSVDATPAMELLARLKQHPAWAGVRVTPLVLVAKALLSAVRRHPGINARWDEAAQEIVQPHYVNLGIAAATERGLVVPNIKDAHAMGLAELARAIESLVSTARSGRSLPVDMARGTITVTNLGSLGVDGGTPILNPGEAAILAMGAIRPMPWVVGDRVEPRQVAHLAMSFDHRLVDGELGARVLVAVGEMLSDPAVALLGP